MNKIGFTNFRKFINFPTIDLGGITILVGGNNAGKSSIVKAMLLMRDFIQTRIVNSDNIKPLFKFDTEHVSIGNFSRAVNRNSRKNSDTISFELGLEEFLIKVDVKGDKKSDMEPIVSTVTINDSINTVEIIINYSEELVSVKFGVSDSYKEKESRRRNLRREIEKKRRSIGYGSFKEQFHNEPLDLDHISRIKAEIEQLEKELRLLDKNTEAKEQSATIELRKILGYRTGNLLLPELISRVLAYSSEETIGDRRMNLYSDEEASKAVIKSRAGILKRMSFRLNQAIANNVIEYIYAHSVSQQVFYNIVTDSNDYVTRAIHEFYQARITDGDEEFEILCHWLKEFEVGSYIDVIAMKGEAYQVLVYDDKNKKGIDLADKGMGSIQMTILLLRLVTLIRKYKGSNLTVLLEEPEQNLHPALQSKLADLLFSINNNKEYGLNFIIETHSEYLVRHAQVLAARLLYEVKVPLEEVNKTIKVYYLSNERGVVDMLFMDNAKFKDSFDEGFFDQASREALTISRLERINKN